jgi:hypothetical protein
MHLVDAFFASYAEVGDDGRFHAVGGGIDVMLIPQINSMLAILSVVARIHFNADECGKPHTLRISATRPDGSDTGVVGERTLEPEKSKNFPEIGTTLQVAINIANLLIPSEGLYTFTLLVDEHIRESRKLGFRVQ